MMTIRLLYMLKDQKREWLASILDSDDSTIERSELRDLIHSDRYTIYISIDLYKYSRR